MRQREQRELVEGRWVLATPPPLLGRLLVCHIFGNKTGRIGGRF